MPRIGKPLSDLGHPTRLARVAACLAVIGGALLYRPWTPAPFDFLDFSEFVPLLRGAPSPWDAFHRLFAYYLDHGRVNAVVYALTVAKWELFGDWTPGWHLSRLLLYALTIGTAARLYLRVGASAPGALMGAAILLVAPTATPGWIRLSMGEVLGTYLLLVASHVALGARAAGSPTRHALALAALVLLLGFTKEMLLVGLVLPVGLYLWPLRGEGSRWQQRVRFLMPAAVASVVVTGVVLWGARHTADVGYGQQYGRDLPAPWELLPPWLFSFMPFDPFAEGDRGFLVGCILAFVISIVAGWTRVLAARDPEQRRRSLAWLALALTLPALLAVVYAPWPVFNRFYYLPAAATLGGLVAIGFTGLSAVPRLPRGAGLTAILTALLLGAVQGRGEADRAFAVRWLIHDVARALGDLGGTDTVFVGARTVSSQQWQGLPATLQRYGVAMGIPLPPLVGTSCDTGIAATRDPTRRVAYLGFASACAVPTSPTRVIHRSFRRLRLTALQVVDDSIRVDLIAPTADRR